MAARNRGQTLFVMPSPAAAITGNTEALLVPDVPVLANFMYPGRLLHGRVFGKASCVVTTPGTQTFKLRWGGIAGTVLATSAALTQNVAAQTDDTWLFDFYVQCISAGVLGTFLTYGHFVRGNRAVGALADITPDLIPATGLANVVVDSTVDKLLSLTYTSSVTTASITAMSYFLEAMM